MTTDVGARSTAAHRAAMTELTQDVARFLLDHLGASMTAHIAGVDRRTIHRWADGSTARARGEKNLRAAYRVFQLVQAVDAPDTVRAWFMGTNPQLEEASPAEAIAEGHYRDVLAAARAFVSAG